MEYGLLSAEEMEERIYEEEARRRKMRNFFRDFRPMRKVKYITWEEEEGEGWLIGTRIYKFGGKDITPEVKIWKEEV